MGKTAILAVKVISDGKDASKGIKQVETAGERMGRRMGVASRVAKVGLVGLAVAGYKAAKAAAADEASQSRLAGALRKNAGASKEAIAGAEEWIDVQSRAKGVADDELRPALATLVSATGNVAQSQKDLALAMDISAARGKPLKAVSAALAKGYDGNAAALAKMVPGIDKAIIKSGDMTRITAELTKKVGGDAADAAATNEGKTRRMAIAFGELQEKLGAYLLPVMLTLSTTLTSVAAFIDRNSTSVAILAAGLGVLGVAVVTINAGYKAYKSITKAAAAAQAVFNAIMSANPIAIVVLAIAALAAGFIVAYKKSDRFRAIVQTVGRVGKQAIGWVVDKAKDLWNWLGKLGPAMNKGKDVAKVAFKVYTTPIRTVIDLVKKLVGWIGKIKFPKIPKGLSNLAGKVGLGGPGAPAAVGGSGYGTSSREGRGGPGDGSLVLPAGGGRYGYGTTIINVYGALDPMSVGDQLDRILVRRDRRLGRLATG